MEDAAGARPLAAAPRTQYLTRELLSWATNALEAVFATAECQASSHARRDVRAALLSLDDLVIPLVRREADAEEAHALERLMV
jgi:hypothetical protein